MGRDVRRYVQPPGGSITDTLSNNFLKSVNIMPSFWYFSPREYHGKASKISQTRPQYGPVWKIETIYFHFKMNFIFYT